MKTSNFILVGLAIGFVSIIVSGFLIIDYKFNHRLFVNLGPDLNSYSAASFARTTKVVDIRNIEGCRIIPSDSLKMRFQAGSLLTYEVVNDTLRIESLGGQSSKTHNIRVYIPESTSVIGHNSRLEIIGRAANEKLKALTFQLDNSVLRSARLERQTRQFFGDLTVEADDLSTISLTDKDQVNRLKVSLVKSTLDCQFTNIGMLILDADSESTVYCKKYNETITMNSSGKDKH